MDHDALARQLSNLPLGPIRYFDTIGSTNAEAAFWAQTGVPDLALVVADEQTAGRGRHGRRWHTPSGAALAFSLILLPESLPSLDADQIEVSRPALTRVTALGALAVCDGLITLASSDAIPIDPQVKWPNDVLVAGRKLAGVLVESHWHGKHLTALVLGIGINVAPPSLPPEEELAFPATCVEEVLGKPVDRWQLLNAVLEALLRWRVDLASQDFIQAWDRRLAYKGKIVHITNLARGEKPIQGEIAGLTPAGSLRLRLSSGEVRTLHSDEVHLRPVDRLPK